MIKNEDRNVYRPPFPVSRAVTVDNKGKVSWLSPGTYFSQTQGLVLEAEGIENVSFVQPQSLFYEKDRR